MSKSEKILEGLKFITNRHPGVNPDSIVMAVVDSVDDDNNLECTADDLKHHNVRVRTLAEGALKSFAIVPKVGSYVLMGCIDDSNEWVVLSVAEADKVVADIGGITFEINSDGIQLNGDGFDGLVKVGALKSKLNSIENKVNSILQTLQSVVVPLAPSGTYPFAPLFASITALGQTQQSEIENTKVKHG